MERAFATIDKDGGIHYLSREDFDLMKKRNPRLMELRACGLAYLTEVPERKKLPPRRFPSG